MSRSRFFRGFTIKSQLRIAVPDEAGKVKAAIMLFELAVAGVLSDD